MPEDLVVNSLVHLPSNTKPALLAGQKRAKKRVTPYTAPYGNEK